MKQGGSGTEFLAAVGTGQRERERLKDTDKVKMLPRGTQSQTDPPPCGARLCPAGKGPIAQKQQRSSLADPRPTALKCLPLIKVLSLCRKSSGECGQLGEPKTALV